MLCPAGHKTRNDTSKSKQTLVDVSGLAGLLFGRPGTTNVLGSGQVDQIQLSNFVELIAVDRALTHVHGHGKDGVRPENKRFLYCIMVLYSKFTNRKIIPCVISLY
jgi:hypothetical protein